MNLSTGGRVVLIDDTYNEVKPLMEALGKQNVPYQYFDGSLEQLPDSPPDGVRFVFLDIELKGAEGSPDKTKASMLTAVLKTIISKSNGPYVIIFWTKHNEVINLVLDNCSKISIPPVAFVDLEKSECINGEDGTYDIEKITKKINSELTKIGAFALYVEWENILNTSGKKFIDDFSRLVAIDDNWSKNTSSLFYKLYKSYVGKNELPDPVDQFKCACQIMNQSFSDKLQEISSNNLQLPEGLKLAHGQIDQKTTAKLNSSLFIGEGVLPHSSTGDVYREENEKIKGSLCLALFKKGKVPSEPTLCKAILTPECDIAQTKMLKIITSEDGKDSEYKYHRVVYGVMFASDDKPNKLKDDKGRDAQFEIGPIWYGEKIQYILFHFSSISFQSEEMLSEAPLFTLKRDLVFDLQSKAANHVNRLGNFQLS